MAMMKGGYYSSWSQTFFPPASIDTQYFTHIYYAFINPNPATFKFDTISNSDHIRKFIHALRPSVKTLFSIGGADHSDFFAHMASNQFLRGDFIKDCIKVARDYGFDGIDVDWEFPKTEQEMKNYGILLQQMRAAVNEEAGTGTALILSAAVYYAIKGTAYWVPQPYPADLMGKELDWINIMAYDYHGTHDANEGIAFHAPLHDPHGNIKNSDYGIRTWIEAGVPQNKLVMGLPLYGKTWKLNSSANPRIGDIPGEPGPNSPRNGTEMTYAEVALFNTSNSNALVEYNNEYVAASTWAGTKWIGYDDTTTVQKKVEYIKKEKLGGYFFWSVNMDDNWIISKAASEAAKQA